MARKSIPWNNEILEEIADAYGTPVYVYDERGILENGKRLNDEFSRLPHHRNFFAVKATPTPAILRIVRDLGMGFDCSSEAELELVARFDLQDTPLFFTSNNTPDSGYARAIEMGAIINLDKADYLAQVKRVAQTPPSEMSIRYNPGAVNIGDSIIGPAAKAKFGATADDVLAAVSEMRQWGVEKIGVHVMAVSNEKRTAAFIEIAHALKDLVANVRAYGLSIDFLNVGGGIGVQYHPDESPVELAAIAEGVSEVLSDLAIPVYSENGRSITGSSGYLLTRVTHGVQMAHEPFLQVDTSVNNIARLATVTAAYHQLDIVGKEHEERVPMNVTGSMCANSDVMFRGWTPDDVPKYTLPKSAAAGDLLVIHDAGAHCRSNSHNYNSRLRCGEVLVRVDGSHTLIRRHETLDDLFATVVGF